MLDEIDIKNRQSRDTVNVGNKAHSEKNTEYNKKYNKQIKTTKY